MQPISDGNTPLDRSRRWWPPLVVILAAIHLYCPPTRVAELEVVPDSVEYAVAAHRFATTGKYEIQVNGRALPPRYPPGFSVVFLAPIYAIAPGNIGNGIVAVWAAGVLAALFAYLIGQRLSGPWGGVLAAVLLVQHPQFIDYSHLIMTDVPAVALGLAACWLYLRVRVQEQPPVRIYVIAGVIVALSISIRPLTGLLAIPFILDIAQRRESGKGIWRKLFAVAIPGSTTIAATSFQQWHAFGDWRRTGYQFWLAVPYDYFSLTFSPRHLKDNLELFERSYPHANLLWVPIAIGVIGIVALSRKRAPNLSAVLFFLLLTALPLSLVHLFYFFRDIRFHLLLIALLSILGGSGIAALIPRAARQRAWSALALVALAILIPRPSRESQDEPRPIRYEVATTCAKLLPFNAILISGVDPDYLEQMVARGTARRILPLDRETQYATSILAWRRIPNPSPPPRNAADHACAGLINGGDERLYPFTADEAMGPLREWVRSGVPVYLELESREPKDRSLTMLRSAFRFVAVSPAEPWLVRLTLPPEIAEGLSTKDTNGHE